jgi:ketosteroid isomerase-like protein
VTTSITELADLVRSALTDGDLDAYQDLLAPNAHWGPPDDPEWGCHNRSEILAWYKAARGEGMRAVVEEVVPGAGALLVGVTVSGTVAAEEGGGAAPRWQVMTVRDGRITDICGFDDRAEAARRAGVPG